MKIEIPEPGEQVVNPDGTTVHRVASVAGTGTEGYLVFLDDKASTLVELYEEPHQHLPHRTWRVAHVLF